MILSHKKKFIMLQPWKTASQTMVNRLMAYQESPYFGLYDFNPFLNRVISQHLTCADLAALPEGKLRYLVAAFVRNPYDRAYSGFRQLQTDIREQTLPSYPFPTPWVREHVRKQLSEISKQMTDAEMQFDRWIELITEDQIYEAGRNSNFVLHPAHYWTHSAGSQVARFIGRVEDFERDFRKFLSLVKIAEVPTVNANVVDLEGGASSNPYGYRYVDRMNGRSIQKINRLFEKDFELFGYERLNL